MLLQIKVETTAISNWWCSWHWNSLWILYSVWWNPYPNHPSTKAPQRANGPMVWGPEPSPGKRRAKRLALSYSLSSRILRMKNFGYVFPCTLQGNHNHWRKIRTMVIRWPLKNSTRMWCILHTIIAERFTRRGFTHPWTEGTSMTWEDVLLRSPAMSARRAKSVSWSISRADLRDSRRRTSSRRLRRSRPPWKRRWKLVVGICCRTIALPQIPGTKLCSVYYLVEPRICWKWKGPDQKTTSRRLKHPLIRRPKYLVLDSFQHTL